MFAPTAAPIDPTELFVALVAAIGTDVGMVSDQLRIGLKKYAYTVHPLRLSDYLAEQSEEDFRRKPFDERVWEAMNAGDQLRADWGRGDALALHAVSDIVATRKQLAAPMPNQSQLPDYLNRSAFLLRSLKTPDELETLRSIYGPRLIVIAAYSPKDKRRDHLARKIAASRGNDDQTTWVHGPDELIRRDEREERVRGQDVSDTFHRADFFVRGWDEAVAKSDLDRILEVLFGSPFRTPTRAEHGQFIAAGAALRSAELSRQVGAAIAAPDGSIVAVGTNEVPTAGGGSRWEEDGRGNRDFEVGDVDTNRQQFDELAARLTAQIDARVATIVNDADSGDATVRATLEAVRADVRSALPTELHSGGLKDLTEFGRAMHAEMAALLDAAMRGVPVRGATLYTTTFPCHNCARHIIGAGIARVVFIEPYTKSRAEQLHADSATIGRVEDAADTVVFEPFVGVAPRRYLELFDAARRERLGHVGRRDRDGTKRRFVRSVARPVFSDAGLEQFRPDVREYRSKELIALTHLVRHQSATESVRSARQGTQQDDKGDTTNG